MIWDSIVILQYILILNMTMNGMLSFSLLLLCEAYADGEFPYARGFSLHLIGHSGFKWCVG